VMPMAASGRKSEYAQFTTGCNEPTLMQLHVCIFLFLQ